QAARQACQNRIPTHHVKLHWFRDETCGCGQHPRTSYGEQRLADVPQRAVVGGVRHLRGGSGASRSLHVCKTSAGHLKGVSPSGSRPRDHSEAMCLKIYCNARISLIFSRVKSLMAGLAGTRTKTLQGDTYSSSTTRPSLRVTLRSMPAAISMLWV